MLLRLTNLDVCQIKRAYCARFFLWLARMPDMTLFQKILIFYAVMAVISFLITWFLTHDKKRIRFLSAFLVSATWPISFPVALLFSLF
ncbi:GhoT/OrtT family toxin [Salmonella enterica subsp. enterica]|nr:GhoT/OrtT family toxin [Salmonella enterica subsp. enterica serovar Poona]